MKHMIWALCVLLALLPCAALAQDVDLGTLVPMEQAPQADAQTLELYCGPTQGFYRHEEQTLNTGAPYVIFGQYDCWAMAAQGTAALFGPIGWVEAGSLPDLPYEPQLSFEDGFAAMIEEPAPMTNDPLGAADTVWTAVLEPGAQVIVLAQLDGWLYVQADIADTPVRAFIPAQAIE